jgi:hypothetical protein
MEIMEVSSTEHTFRLIQHSKKVREKIVHWLSNQESATTRKADDLDSRPRSNQLKK